MNAVECSIQLVTFQLQNQTKRRITIDKHVLTPSAQNCHTKKPKKKKNKIVITFHKSILNMESAIMLSQLFRLENIC